MWQYAKCKICTETLTYASQKAKERNKKQKYLEVKIRTLEDLLHTDNTLITEYNNCKSELEEILNYKVEGIKLRSQAKWTEDGEKNTQYFFKFRKT